MRTHLFRGAMALAVLLTVSAVPALAQSVVRGKVVDAQGKAVADATVLFEATDANRKTQTKTDKNGEFLQVGLSSGSYKVTASKDGVGSQTLNSNVRQGPNNPLSFTLTLGPKRWNQVSGILTQYAPGVTNAYVKITRTAGNNPFVAYAVVNDGGAPGLRSGDGAFVTMDTTP